MKITVTKKALAWFKQELTFPAGAGVHFYGKVYGATNVHEGFSVGMSVDTPINPIYEETIDGILFFVEETDAWFFADYNLQVDYDEKLDEPNYFFSE